jgi:hypothetical protein
MLYLFFSLLSSLELITCCRRISEEVVVEVEVVVMVVAAADKSVLFFNGTWYNFSSPGCRYERKFKEF